MRTDTAGPVGRALLRAAPLFAALWLALAHPLPARAEGGDSAYFSLKPLVVDVRDGARERFLQVTAELKLADPAAGELVRKHLAPVRDSLILLLSDQEVGPLLRPDGREALRKAALKAVRGALSAPAGKAPVEGLYFTGFVIQ